MPHAKLALVGFGNVGRALAVLLEQKRAELKDGYDITFQVNGIATGRHGLAIAPDGLDLSKALELVKNGRPLNELSTVPVPANTLAFVQTVPADILFENSPVNHKTGQPAIDYLHTALERGMHAITANKGPVAHAFRELKAFAEARGKRFLYESTVMDGAPIFSMFRGPLPAVHILRITGVLNSTTNQILEMMENGQTFDEAVQYCIRVGLAETDPSADIDGWDASIKLAILVTLLMGYDLTPQQINRTGIRGITPEMIAEVRQAGERWKLICSAVREGDSVRARVAPERVKASSHMYSIRVSGSAVEFDLDVQPALGIYKDDSGPDTTAYGLLADMINALRGT